jgi:hypothetical protein
MNAISASAPERVAADKVTTPTISAKALADQLAPRDHAGKGAWDSNADIPPIAWLGALLFAFVFLVVLPWLGHGAGF